MNWPKNFNVQFTVGVAAGKLHPSPNLMEKSAGRGFSGLLFSHSVVSNSLQPRGLQHSRLSCPLPSPKVCSNSCRLSWWCHPTISSSAAPFSSYHWPFPASGFKESALCLRWPKYWSFSFNISTSNDYSRLTDRFDLLAVQGTLKSLLQHTVRKHQFSGVQPSLWANS